MAQENLEVIYQSNSKNKKDTNKVNNIVVKLESYVSTLYNQEQEQEHFGGKKNNTKKRKLKAKRKNKTKKTIHKINPKKHVVSILKKMGVPVNLFKDSIEEEKENSDILIKNCNKNVKNYKVVKDDMWEYFINSTCQEEKTKKNKTKLKKRKKHNLKNKKPLIFNFMF